MAPFSKENQLVWALKMSSKGELVIWRTKIQARVQLKDSIGFKLVPRNLDPTTPSKVGLRYRAGYLRRQSHPRSVIPRLILHLWMLV
jgi:hypothetical protein